MRLEGELTWLPGRPDRGSGSMGSRWGVARSAGSVSHGEHDPDAAKAWFHPVGMPLHGHSNHEPVSFGRVVAPGSASEPASRCSEVEKQRQQPALPSLAVGAEYPLRHSQPWAGLAWVAVTWPRRRLAPRRLHPQLGGSCREPWVKMLETGMERSLSIIYLPFRTAWLKLGCGRSEPWRLLRSFGLRFSALMMGC